MQKPFKERVARRALAAFAAAAAFASSGAFAYEADRAATPAFNSVAISTVTVGVEDPLTGTGIELDNDAVASHTASSPAGAGISGGSSRPAILSEQNVASSTDVVTHAGNNGAGVGSSTTTVSGGAAFCDPIDVTDPAKWSWDSVAKQTNDANKTHGTPQWLGCLIGKTKITPDRTFDKLAHMPPVLGANIGHRGIKIDEPGVGWAVGFPSAPGPVCRLADTPGGSYLGEYSADGRCASVIWVSEQPGGEPICYTDPTMGGSDGLNWLDIPPASEAIASANAGGCGRLVTGHRYYCNFTAVGFGEVRPAPGKPCNWAVVGPMTQTDDPD